MRIIILYIVVVGFASPLPETVCIMQAVFFYAASHRPPTGTPHFNDAFRIHPQASTAFFSVRRIYFSRNTS